MLDIETHQGERAYPVVSIDDTPLYLMRWKLITSKKLLARRKGLSIMKMKILLLIVVLNVVVGCASVKTTHRGMVENNTFRSTDHPRLDIKVSDLFKYKKTEGMNKIEHSFFLNNKFVFIEFYKNTAIKNRVDYYYPIYSIWKFPNVISEGNKEVAGVKWYYWDYVKLENYRCAIVRQMAMRNRSKDILYFRYGNILFGSNCRGWEGSEVLTPELKSEYEKFKRNFNKDITLSVYNP